MSSFQVLDLYVKNIDFVKTSIDMIINKNYTSHTVEPKEIYKQPTFYEIIKEKFNF